MSISVKQRPQAGSLSLGGAYLRGIGISMLFVGAIWGVKFLNDVYDAWFHGKSPSSGS